MHKRLVSIIVLCCVILCAAGCSSKNKKQETTQKTENSKIENTKKEESTEPVEINVGCMKGPTAIGMVKMLSDSDKGIAKNHYKYTIAGTADEISVGLVNESLDIAAVPCNLASVLYNKTKGEVITAAINTLGVLYIVESGNSIQEVKDLAGKTIYSTGQGTTPEYTLRYLLTSAGLDPDKDVTIEYKSEATEVVASFAKESDAVAMLPQPYVTIAQNSNESLRIALDVTEEWEKLNKDSTVVTGVIVARKSFVEQNPEAFQNFLAEYKTSTEYANSNIKETAALLEEFDVFKAAIAEKAIPYCNVTYIDGKEMSSKVMSYLTILYEQNPLAVGGKLPEEGIFYIENSKES